MSSLVKKPTIQIGATLSSMRRQRQWLDYLSRVALFQMALSKATVLSQFKPWAASKESGLFDEFGMRRFSYLRVFQSRGSQICLGLITTEAWNAKTGDLVQTLEGYSDNVVRMFQSRWESDSVWVWITL